MDKLKEIVLNGHIHCETDFWITAHLPNSGMYLDIMKKDLIKRKTVSVSEIKETISEVVKKYNMIISGDLREDLATAIVKHLEG